MIGFVFGAFVLLALVKGIEFLWDWKPNAEPRSEAMHQEDLKQFSEWAFGLSDLEEDDQGRHVDAALCLDLYNSIHGDRAYVAYKGDYGKCFKEMYHNWLRSFK